MRQLLVTFLFSVISIVSSAGDPPATHGMLLFGKETIYLSHLPMFHSPHDYQLILEVTLRPEAKKAFLKDQATHPNDRLYTLVPERFVLPDMVKAPRPFTADLVRGHFERGGITFLRGAVVSIAKVIAFTKLDPKTPALPSLRYLIFGKGNDTYLAHLITSRPNFDHILPARTENRRLLKLLEEKPSVVVEIPKLSDDKPVGEEISVTAQIPGDKESSDTLTTLQQFYLEFGDLAE